MSKKSTKPFALSPARTRAIVDKHRAAMAKELAEAVMGVDTFSHALTRSHAALFVNGHWKCPYCDFAGHQRRAVTTHLRTCTFAAANASMKTRSTAKKQP